MAKKSKAKATKSETTYEDVVALQTEAKAAVKDSKTALTTYYKENKLKRNGDYSEDKKHGKKIATLEGNVEKAQEKLTSLNAQAKELKPETARRTKYEYPDDIDTPEKRKKYRQEMRAKANGKTKKEKPAKASKKAKTEDAAEETEAAAPVKSSKGKVKKKSIKKKSSKKTSDD